MTGQPALAFDADATDNVADVDGMYRGAPPVPHVELRNLEPGQWIGVLSAAHTQLVVKLAGESEAGRNCSVFVLRADKLRSVDEGNGLGSSLPERTWLSANLPTSLVVAEGGPFVIELAHEGHGLGELLLGLVAELRASGD